MRIKFLAVLPLALVAVLAGGAPAFAHVTINPPSSPKRGEVTLGFQVPSEEPNADTNQFQIFFPLDHPIVEARPESIRGWQDKITMRHLPTPVQTADGPVADVISEIDWSGGPIAAGHFFEFRVLVPSLPADTDQLVFKALQTYSDGTVVRWIDPVTATQPNPDHPTPILRLTPPASDLPTSGSPSSSVAGPVLGQISDSVAGLAKSGSVNTARTVGIIGIVIGIVGLAVALVALRASRRGSQARPD